MKKLFFILALAVVLSGCCCPITPLPDGGDGGNGGLDGGLGAQTDWCNATIGTAIATGYGASGLRNVVVEGVKTVEGKQMCSVRMDYTDPETNESGAMKAYFTEDGEDSVVEIYDATGKMTGKWKVIDGIMTMYDGEGNVIYTGPAS